MMYYRIEPGGILTVTAPNGDLFESGIIAHFGIRWYAINGVQVGRVEFVRRLHAAFPGD